MFVERSPYREYPPHSALRPFVQCYWSIEPSPFMLTNRVLPDGCLDILFTPSDASNVMRIVGTMQRAELHRMDGTQTIVGVRFKPGGAFPFLRLPLHELTDNELNLNELWGSSSRELSERMLEERFLPAKIARLESALLSRYGALPGVDPLLCNALHLIHESCGAVPVQELVARLALSERQLERRFRQHTGLSPKAFARVTRFRATVIALQRELPLALDDFAQDMGFYDQAHFIHDFKAFSGVTPTEYMQEYQDVGFLQYAARLP